MQLLNSKKVKNVQNEGLKKYINVMSFDVRNPNPMFIFIGRNRKTSKIRKNSFPRLSRVSGIGRRKMDTGFQFYRSKTPNSYIFKPVNSHYLEISGWIIPNVTQLPLATEKKVKKTFKIMVFTKNSFNNQWSVFLRANFKQMSVFVGHYRQPSIIRNNN